MTVCAKESELFVILKRYERVAIAFSGGVDSACLAAAAQKALGNDNVLLVHASCSFVPRDEEDFAAEWAEKSTIPYRKIMLSPLDDDNIRKNVPRRCYYCKKLIMSAVIKAAAEHGIKTVADGANCDDQGDYRPGMTAADELGIQHPLIEAGFGKDAIRLLAEKYHLPNWNAPASACLASRVPYGVSITPEILRMIDAAETFLHGLGFRGCRVRYYAGSAKIETIEADVTAAAKSRGVILHEFRKIGFREALLDLQGYRQGALNETL